MWNQDAGCGMQDAIPAPSPPLEAAASQSLEFTGGTATGTKGEIGAVLSDCNRLFSYS